MLATIGIRLLGLLSQERDQGMYEILDYESTLEITDVQGHLAQFHKRQRVRFLQNTIAFQDYAWGEGDIFVDYRCTPGTVVDYYREGDRWNILISLRETKSKGDIEEFHIERTITDGFTKAEEWFQAEIRHPTRRLYMAVILPAARPCRRALLRERSQNRTTVLGPQHVRTLPDGRQLITWETACVRHLEVYTLGWEW